jgi:hypothetical protein
MKSSFSHADLRGIDPLGKFDWHHTPALGRSGGMLLGVNEDAFDVLGWYSCTFFIHVDVRQLDTSKDWSLFVVYGPADHRRSPEFLSELSLAVRACPLPLVVGGDFNMIRGSDDKKNDNIGWPRVHRFNECVANLAHREVRRTGARYTRTTRQLNPVRCVLDRVFILADWESLFPLCSLVADTIIGPQPLPLDSQLRGGVQETEPSFLF